MPSVETFKDNIILDLIELEKLDEVEMDIIVQVKKGKFDEHIKELEEYASVTDATDSIRMSYRIRNTK
jgi:hypothetical protein